MQTVCDTCMGCWCLLLVIETGLEQRERSLRGDLKSICRAAFSVPTDRTSGFSILFADTVLKVLLVSGSGSVQPPTEGQKPAGTMGRAMGERSLHASARDRLSAVSGQARLSSEESVAVNC